MFKAKNLSALQLEAREALATLALETKGTREQAELLVREYEAAAAHLLTTERWNEGYSRDFLEMRGVSADRTSVDARLDSEIQRHLNQYWPKAKAHVPTWRESLRTQD